VILEGKVVVVAGVGEGLGREVAAVALRDGAQVVVAARSEEKLRGIAEALDPSGERILAAPADILDNDACDALMKSAIDRFGGIDAVVNVAAFDSAFGTLESTPADDWRRTLEMNVIGTSQVVRAAVGPMTARGGGAVVLIGSPPDRVRGFEGGAALDHVSHGRGAGARQDSRQHGDPDLDVGAARAALRQVAGGRARCQ